MSKRKHDLMVTDKSKNHFIEIKNMKAFSKNKRMRYAIARSYYEEALKNFSSKKFTTGKAEVLFKDLLNKAALGLEMESSGQVKKSLEKIYSHIAPQAEPEAINELGESKAPATEAIVIANSHSTFIEEPAILSGWNKIEYAMAYVPVDNFDLATWYSSASKQERKKFRTSLKRVVTKIRDAFSSGLRVAVKSIITTTHFQSFIEFFYKPVADEDSIYSFSRLSINCFTVKNEYKNENRKNIIRRGQ